MSAPDMTVSSKSAPSSAKIWSAREEQQKISRMFHTCSESKASHHKMEDPSLEKHLQSSNQRHHCQLSYYRFIRHFGVFVSLSPADKTEMKHLECGFSILWTTTAVCLLPLLPETRLKMYHPHHYTSHIIIIIGSSWQQQWIFATIQYLREEEADQNPVITRPSLSASSQNPDIIRDNMGCAPLAPADKLQ